MPTYNIEYWLDPEKPVYWFNTYAGWIASRGVSVQEAFNQARVTHRFLNPSVPHIASWSKCIKRHKGVETVVHTKPPPPSYVLLHQQASL